MSCDFNCLKVGAGDTAMIAGEGGTGKVQLDAALAPAVADVLVVFARHRVVPPLAGDGIGAGEHLAVDDDAAADAGAEDHAEHRLRAGAGTIDGFRQRETVGIVGEAHVASQRRFEVALERLADQAGRVGVLDQARDARFGTRYADAHRSASADSFFSRSDQFDHRSQCRGVVTLRRRHALAQQDVAIVAEDDDLDLAAAEVDADAHQVLCRITCRTIP